MILFDEVVEIFTLSQFTGVWQNPLRFELLFRNTALCNHLRFTSVSGEANLSGHMVVVLCRLEANPPGLFDDRERSEDH